MSNYEIRISTIESLLADSVKLNKKLSHLRNHTTVTNAIEVVNFANGISLRFSVVSSAIDTDLRANWIDINEYKILTAELEKVRGILTMLEVEV